MPARFQGKTTGNACYLWQCVPISPCYVLCFEGCAAPVPHRPSLGVGHHRHTLHTLPRDLRMCARDEGLVLLPKYSEESEESVCRVCVPVRPFMTSQETMEITEVITPATTGAADQEAQSQKRPASAVKRRFDGKGHLHADSGARRGVGPVRGLFGHSTRPLGSDAQHPTDTSPSGAPRARCTATSAHGRPPPHSPTQNAGRELPRPGSW